MEYHSVSKRKKFAICKNMNALGGYYEKGNNSDKDKYYMISLICRI